VRSTPERVIFTESKITHSDFAMWLHISRAFAMSPTTSLDKKGTVNFSRRGRGWSKIQIVIFAFEMEVTNNFLVVEPEKSAMEVSI